MIQFNLLPDVKLEYLKARRTQSLVTTFAAVISAASLFILIVLFLVVNVFQSGHLKAVNKDIASYTSELNDNQELPKILTVQNQLKSLPGLLAQRPVTSRLFKDLPKIIPAKVSISQITIDFQQNTLNFTGNAPNIQTINQLVDTLKFTNYTTDTSDTPVNAFSNVVLTSFGKTDKGASYAVTASFDPTIFNSSVLPNLTVPAGPRSASTELFKDTPQTTNQSGTQAQ